jgi:hypothetical protein
MVEPECILSLCDLQFVPFAAVTCTRKTDNKPNITLQRIVPFVLPSVYIVMLGVPSVYIVMLVVPSVYIVMLGVPSVYRCLQMLISSPGARTTTL